MADTPKDYFKILDVGRDASLEEIKKAYRRLAPKYHPDTGNVEDEELIKELNQAHNTLKDPDKRKAHLKELVKREQHEQKRREKEQQRRKRAPNEEAANAFGEGIRSGPPGKRPPYAHYPPPQPKQSAPPASATQSTPPLALPRFPIATAALATMPWAVMITGIGLGMSLLGTIWAATSFAAESESPHYGEGLGFLLQISAVTAIPAIAALWAAGCLAAVSRHDPSSYIGDLMERSSYRLMIACSGVIPPLIFVVIHWEEDFRKWGGSASGPPLWWWLLGPVFLCICHIAYLSLDRIEISGGLRDAWVIPATAAGALLLCIPIMGLPPLHL